MRPTFWLVPDFIVPHLNNETYGNHLHWENRQNGNFKISRIHQSSEMWNEHCIEVYKAWSIRKKLWKKEDPKRISKAKHRLITALRRNPEIQMLEKESTFYRFRIIHQNIPDDEKVGYGYGDVTDGNSLHISEKEPQIENKTPENTEVNDSCDFKSIFEVGKENIDSGLFSNCENLINSSCYLSLPELYDNTPKMFPLSGILSDELYPSEVQSADSSDRCCCDVLLDNYLCNQKCIWHGSPP